MAEWYRFEDKRYANTPDEFGESRGSHLVVELRRFPVLRETRTGVWLQIFPGMNRFTRRDVYRRFACPTIEEAFESYRARKAKQIRIYQARVESAREALLMAERIVERSVPRAAVPAPEPAA